MCVSDVVCWYRPPQAAKPTPDGASYTYAQACTGAVMWLKKQLVGHIILTRDRSVSDLSTKNDLLNTELLLHRDCRGLL